MEFYFIFGNTKAGVLNQGRGIPYQREISCLGFCLQIILLKPYTSG